MNPSFNFNISDYFIVIDTEEITPLDEETIQHIRHLFEQDGLHPTGTFRIPRDAFREVRAGLSTVSRDAFNNEFAACEATFDRKILSTYTHSQELRQALTQPGSDIKDILWQNLQATFQKPESLPFDLLMPILEYIVSEHPDTHLAIVFLRHNLVVDCLTSNGSFNYHVVGRGFYSFGTNIPLRVRNTPPPHAYGAILGMNLVRGLDKRNQCAFAQEQYRHEFIGHAKSGLHDHHGEENYGCVMHTRATLEEAVRVAVARSDMDFCSDCRKLMAT